MIRFLIRFRRNVLANGLAVVPYHKWKSASIAGEPGSGRDRDGGPLQDGYTTAQVQNGADLKNVRIRYSQGRGGTSKDGVAAKGAE